MLSFRNSGGNNGSGDGSDLGKFAVLAEVRGYWEGLRDGASLPRRDQIDPRGIAGALESVFLLERVAPGIARFRLAGMQINDLLGMDVRGMPLSALIDPEGRWRLASGLTTLFLNPGILEFRFEAERGIGRPALEARMLLLPLLNTRGQSDLALGYLALHGQIGRAPRRFAIAGMVSEPLILQAQIPQARDLAKPPVRTKPRLVLLGMAESDPGFSPAPFRMQSAPPPRGRPQLRVIQGRG